MVGHPVIFGSTEAYCYAVEEQGRNTLHAHFIIWVSEWSKLLTGLHNETMREECAEILETYINETVTTKFH